jgi:hypothetical protein
MGMKSFKMLGVLCMMAFTLCISGCASSGRRFYSDPARQVKDVAIVYSNIRCSVNYITESGQPQKNLAGGELFLAELLPGDYSMAVRFVRTTTYEEAVGEQAVLTLHAEPGHVYYIYGKAAGNTWHPEVIDIARDGDYKKIDDAGYGYDIDCVKNSITKYLKGGRIMIQETRVSTQKGMLSIWK